MTEAYAVICQPSQGNVFKKLKQQPFLTISLINCQWNVGYLKKKKKKEVKHFLYK